MGIVLVFDLEAKGMGRGDGVFSSLAEEIL